MNTETINALTRTFAEKIEEYATKVEDLEARLTDSAAINKMLNEKNAELAVKAEMVSDGVSLAFVDRMNKYENLVAGLERRIDALTSEVEQLKYDDEDEEEDVDAAAKVVNSAGLWRGFTYSIGGFSIRAMRDTFMVSNEDVVITRNIFALRKHDISATFNATGGHKFTYLPDKTSANHYLYYDFCAGKTFDRWLKYNSPEVTVLAHNPSSSAQYLEWYNDDILASKNTIFVGSNTLKLSLENAHLHYESDAIEVIYYSKGDNIVVEFCIGDIWFRAGAESFDVIDKPYEVKG